MLLLMVIAAFPAEARKVIVPTLDELIKLSPIICNGRVVTVEDAHQKGTYDTVPVELWKAKVKILGNFKGKAPDEIEFRFWQFDTHPPGGGPAIAVNPPKFAFLNPSSRYRLFLKPSPDQKAYVVSVEGKFDDGYSVQPPADIEPDDNPPALSKSRGDQ